MDELLNIGKKVEEKQKLEEPDDAELERIYKELWLKAQNEKGDGNEVKEKGELNYNTVKPSPGFCVKSRHVDGDKTKVFINVTTSSSAPPPKPITEQELLQILDKYNEDSEETVDYRVPMSIGEGHVEVDNRGEACTAYDIIINPSFLAKLKDSSIFLGFFMSIVTEGLRAKYDIEISRNWTVLKNKKFFGRICEQHMRKRTLVQEIGRSMSKQHEDEAKQPRYVLVREPEEGPSPQFIIAEVELLGVAKASNVMVDCGEDRLVVTTRPKKYSLDIYLPFDVLPEECGSQFDISTHILTITMPVQPSKTTP